MNFISTLIIFGIVFLLWKLYDTYIYWTKIGVKQLSLPDSFRYAVKRLSFPESINRVYQRFSEDRYVGVYPFFRPVLMIRDLDLIRKLTVKDFDHFTDHLSVITDEKHEPLWTKNLLLLKGKKWRHMRATLSPAFTSSKMKAMFNLMIDCAHRFTKHFEQNNNSGMVEVDLKDIFSRYANDVIGTCAFGVQCNSLEERNNEFFVMGKQATNLSGFWRTIQLTFLFALPNISKHIGIKLIATKVNKFFIKLVEDTVNYREEHKILRPDMIHLLMEARKGRLQYDENEKKVKEMGFATVEESNVVSVMNAEKEITTEDMTAQALIFFFAGFDTISTVMSFMGYELSINPDIQQRLFEEIDDTYQKCNGNVTYECLSKMTYFDMVVSETLRKWPPVIAIDRLCTIPYTIQPENECEVPVKLKKDDVIWIPAYGIHHDPKYYPNPEKFDPERFNEENKHKINPYTYMPFGLGPRNCIGSRFALLELKALYFYLLHKYKIVVTEKTPIPLIIKKSSLVLLPERNFMLALKKR